MRFDPLPGPPSLPEREFPADKGFIISLFRVWRGNVLDISLLTEATSSLPSFSYTASFCYLPQASSIMLIDSCPIGPVFRKYRRLSVESFLNCA